jgi:polygalacturonase
MKKFVLLLNLFVSLAAAAMPPGAWYNVKDFGAKGDGSTMDTRTINKTIDKAAAAGGGTVYFPAGNFLSGSIHLKSNICLYIDQGTTNRY